MLLSEIASKDFNYIRVRLDKLGIDIKYKYQSHFGSYTLRDRSTGTVVSVYGRSSLNELLECVFSRGVLTDV